MDALVSALTANRGNTSGDLSDRISYTLKAREKNPDKVSKRDLVSLVKETMKTLGSAFVEPALAEENTEVSEQKTKVESEAFLKKPVGKKTEQDKDTENKADGEGDQSKTKGEKTAPKKVSKKDAVVSLLSDNKEGIIYVSEFAQRFSLTDGEGNTETYERADDIKTLSDLRDAVDPNGKDETIYAMFYWNRSMLRKWQYAAGLVDSPKEFPQDVDITSVIYVSEYDTPKIAYTISAYTEAFYALSPDDLEVTNGVRYSGGAELQLYRKVK